MNKILVIGHLPKSIGGKQSSGLSNVIWALAKNIQKESIDHYKIFLAATDFNENKNIDNVEILGWKKWSILIYAILNLHLCLYYLLWTIYLVIIYKLNFFTVFFKFLFLHQVVIKIKPDLIHLHGCEYPIIMSKVISARNIKSIVTIHGINGSNNTIKNYKYLKKMEEAINKLNLSFGVFITHKIQSEWNIIYGIPLWKSFCINNAYDSEKFFYLPNLKPHLTDKINLITIGSINENKGQIRVIKAIIESKNKKVFAYTCVGGGNESDINYLKKLSLVNGIEFKHYNYKLPNELRELLCNFDYMILPSISEGFGLVFLESIACGVPVILPKDLPITSEKFLNSNNSILLDNSSVTSIKNILDNIDQFKLNSFEVSKSLVNCTWQSISNEYINLLKRIVRC